MDELLRSELEELKRFFVEEGREDRLFQILFLLENVKPGVFLHINKRNKLKQLRNMLYWFNLYVSVRQGGYATKSKQLCREWDRIFRYKFLWLLAKPFQPMFGIFGFKSDAEKFLGYPSCCVKANLENNTVVVRGSFSNNSN